MRRLLVLTLCTVAMVLAAAVGAQAAVPGPYAALGDSYTSGPLVPNQYGDPIGCARSDSNYPSLVRRSLGVIGFRDESCSSATTAHMTTQQAVPLGGVHAPQFDALAPDAALVTIGIGGNDIGLVQAAFTCARLGALAPTGTACRSYHARPADSDVLEAAIAATAPKIAAVLQGIHARAPTARVLLVGYPAVVPHNGKGCHPEVPLSDDDVAYFDGLLVKTNAMLAEQAELNDAEYVDTFTDSLGHDICTPPGTKWFEGLVPTSPAFPVHPNALGMQSMAGSVLRRLGQPRPVAVLSVLVPDRLAIRPGASARFRFTLSRPATVTFVLKRATPGRRRAGRCEAPRSVNRRGAACRRYGAALETIVATARAGDNRLTLSSTQIGRRLGQYRLTATVAGGVAQVASFRVRR